MRIIQDVVKGILPTSEEKVEALEYLNHILPQYEHCVCNGAIGDWRMLPNGSTCFYCPAILLPDMRD